MSKDIYVCMKCADFSLFSFPIGKRMHRSKMRHFVYRILSLRTRRTNERTMSKSNNNKDDDDKNNALRVKPLFSSLLFNIGRDFDEKDDASSSSSRHDGGELARIIRARSTRFLRHASPTVAAVEENVKASIALARGDALTKTLEVHALMDADGKHAGQSLAKVNEDYANAFFLGVEREASSLAKTKRDVEALVEAKEKEREKEEEKRDKETKERRRKELKEAMMFRKEEEEEEEEE